MCTMLTLQAKIAGCGKGAQGWFDLREANVSYDHPFHFHLEHSLNIDFVNEAAGPGARVAVELTRRGSARAGYDAFSRRWKRLKPTDFSRKLRHTCIVIRRART